jgi:hypothetical protein
MQAFDRQRIRLKAINGILDDFAGHSNTAARRLGGDDPHAPIEQFRASKSGKSDVS